MFRKSLLYRRRLIRKKKKTIEQRSCAGCSHIFYYNDGHPGCDIDMDKSCTANDFCFYEEKNNE